MTTKLWNNMGKAKPVGILPYILGFTISLVSLPTKEDFVAIAKLSSNSESRNIKLMFNKSQALQCIIISNPQLWSYDSGRSK